MKTRVSLTYFVTDCGYQKLYYFAINKKNLNFYSLLFIPFACKAVINCHNYIQNPSFKTTAPTPNSGKLNCFL